MLLANSSRAMQSHARMSALDLTVPTSTFCHSSFVICMIARFSPRCFSLFLYYFNICFQFYGIHHRIEVAKNTTAISLLH